MSEETEFKELPEDENLLPEVEDFDQNGLLLKIATNGLSIPDYVKKLKEEINKMQLYQAALKNKSTLKFLLKKLKKM